MSIHLTNLKLNCKSSVEQVDFSPQITVIHGEIATGKSSVARLIDFCLGGNLERTPALQEELVIAQLSLVINDYAVVIRREAQGSKQVQVSWDNGKGTFERRLVPIVKTDTPIFGDDIFTLSDLLLFLLGIPNLKVPNSKDNETIPVSLSFHDIFPFCYLEQDTLDSCFYNLNRDADTFKKRKNKLAIRFIIGFFTEKISELELQIAKIDDNLKRGQKEIDSVRSFLEKFGFNSEKQVDDEISLIRTNLANASKELSEMKAGYLKDTDTDVVGSLRKEVVNLENKISDEEQALRDIAMKISDQERLKSQFDASRFKLSRYQSAKQILEGAVFQNCPACGTEISIAAEDSVCCLCGQQKKLSDEEETEKNKLARLDIEDRIKELNGSIVRFREAYTTQQKQLEDHKRLKQEKNHQLNEILQNYSSEFTTKSEDLIGKIASFEERINNLSRIAEMPKEATRVEKELISFKVEQENLGRQLAEEKKKKVNADHIVKEIEAAYKEALIAVSLPNFDKMDTIVLDSKSWMPAIIPSDKTRNKWDFDNIGSAGMKTLLNVCYALALHKVAAENSLPLPSLLIIDTPSKNVDKEVNREIFESLYSYIYSLAGDILSNTQLILIDNNFYKPPSNLSSIERFMTRSDKNNPPLIRNYKGST